MNSSPSTDRQYRDFNRVFLYKAGTYATGTRYGRTEGLVLGTESLEVDCSVLVFILST